MRLPREITPELADKMMRALDPNSYSPVQRTDVDGYTISTVNTPDHGYETAVVDIKGAHPVERYPDRAAAELGHKKWVYQVSELTDIIILGWMDIVPPEPYTLVKDPSIKKAKSKVSEN